MNVPCILPAKKGASPPQLKLTVLVPPERHALLHLRCGRNFYYTVKNIMRNWRTTPSVHPPKLHKQLARGTRSWLKPTRFLGRNWHPGFGVVDPTDTKFFLLGGKTILKWNQTFISEVRGNLKSNEIRSCHCEKWSLRRWIHLPETWRSHKKRWQNEASTQFDKDGHSPQCSNFLLTIWKTRYQPI